MRTQERRDRVNELHIVETGEVIEEMTRVEAERITSRIADKLDSIADDYEQVVPLIGEALTRNAWKSLGYASPTDYVSERFSGSLKRLPLEVRRPVVKELSEAGMSTRSIAPVIGASRMAVQRDLDSGVTVRDTSPAPKPDAELLAGAEWSPEAVEDEPRFTDEPGHIQPVTGNWNLPKSDKIIGPDGKHYTRPEPKEPQKPRRNPLPDQFFKAIYDLQKNIERVERLIEDDRFQQNKEQIALRHKSDLLRSAELLEELLHKFD